MVVAYVCVCVCAVRNSSCMNAIEIYREREREVDEDERPPYFTPLFVTTVHLNAIDSTIIFSSLFIHRTLS